MVVSILGCGWLGIALAKDLVKQGVEVKGSTTSSAKLQTLMEAGIAGSVIKLDGEEAVDADSDFWNCDVLVIASNVKLAQNPGYHDAMRAVVTVIESKGIQRVIFLSSISVYGEPNCIVDEDTVPAAKTASAEQLLALEALFNDVPEAVMLRLGGLVGPGRMPGAFFAGKKNVPNGEAAVNLIHLADCIGICKLLISASAVPRYLNAVSPDHPAKNSFYAEAATSQGLPLPEFIAEQGQWKIVNSRYIKALGYQFKIDNWLDWIR